MTPRFIARATWVAAVALVLYRTDDAHLRVVYQPLGSRAST